MTRLLDVSGVSKSFGAVQSLADITFAVDDHRIIGLIGPNGAGKSTLINVLTGVYAPDSGSLKFQGQDISKLSTAERARIGLVRTFQRPAAMIDVTCIEGVMIGGLVRGLSISAARAEAYEKLELLGLRDVADHSPRKLPTGHLKLLDFARVLMLAPRLVLLDELMSGLSAGELKLVLAAIEYLAGKGTAFLVVEHLMDVIRRLSRHLVVMDAGRVIAVGAPGDVIRDPRVVEAYIGREMEEADA